MRNKRKTWFNITCYPKFERFQLTVWSILIECPNNIKCIPGPRPGLCIECWSKNYKGKRESIKIRIKPGNKRMSAIMRKCDWWLAQRKRFLNIFIDPDPDPGKSELLCTYCTKFKTCSIALCLYDIAQETIKLGFMKEVAES